MTQNLLRLNDNETSIIYFTSPHCLKSPKDQHYSWVNPQLPLIGQYIIQALFLTIVLTCHFSMPSFLLPP